MPSIDFISNIIKTDKEIFFKDYGYAQKVHMKYEKVDKSNLGSSFNFRDNSNLNSDAENNVLEDNGSMENPLIADFTEYSPLHNGHFHCMKTAKSKVPNGLFVAIVPGLFERSGRGLPYIVHRKIRSEIAVAVGADIVVEGPPMGIMGSGQYSLCLSKMFQALNTDFIPRGYNPIEGYDEILKRISLGHGIAPKPYKIVDMDTNEIVLKGKLEEDNYVIVSFSKSLKKIGFDFKGKFIFVPRIRGVSGTLIRKACNDNDLESVKPMVPKETLVILQREISQDKAPLHNSRYDSEIINNANNLSFEELINLNFFSEKLANNLISVREEKQFESLKEIEDALSYGFSSHFKNRVLSILETKINKNVVSNYIETYPTTIRVLNYKNEEVLNRFKNKIYSNVNSSTKKIEIMN